MRCLMPKSTGMIGEHAGVNSKTNSDNRNKNLVEPMRGITVALNDAAAFKKWERGEAMGSM
jgi:hypothetical protein